jgi:hypothetical protein
MEFVSDVDYSMAMPSSVGVHSTIALAGTYSPANPPTANDPGLNATNVFVDTPAVKGKSMLTKHWVLIGVALLAIWYFFFRSGSTASLAAVAS